MSKEELLTYYQKYRLFIFPAIVAFSALILIIFVIYPQTIKLLTNQKAISETSKKADLLQSKVVALESYDEEDLKKKVDSALFSYPVDKDFGVIIGLLQELAIRSGFSISSITLAGGSEKPTGVQNYTVKMEAIGPKDSLPTLLKNLESSSRLLRVSSIDSTIGNDKLVSVSLSIEALYSAGPGNFGSIGSSLPEISPEEESLLTTLSRVTPATQNSSSTPKGKSNPFE